MITAVVILIGVITLTVLALGTFRDWKKERALKSKENLLRYVAWRRARDMGKYPSLYPSTEQWDAESLHYTIAEYYRDPRWKNRQMREAAAADELMEWVRQNDPVSLQARIRELERELGVGD